jgi:hypothetical protein
MCLPSLPFSSLWTFRPRNPRIFPTGPEVLFYCFDLLIYWQTLLNLMSAHCRTDILWRSMIPQKIYPPAFALER